MTENAAQAAEANQIEAVYEDETLDASDKAETLYDLAAGYLAESDRYRAAIEHALRLRDQHYTRVRAGQRKDAQPTLDAIHAVLARSLGPRAEGE